MAQHSTLHLCRDAGLRREHILAADSATPVQLDRVFAVASDDVMLFSAISKLVVEHTVHQAARAALGNVSKGAQAVSSVQDEQSKLERSERGIVA